MRASCATVTGRHQPRISLTDRLLAKKAVTARPADDDQSYVTSWIASLSFKASSSAHSGCSWRALLSALVRQLDASARIRAARGQRAAATST
jgi:hypothetical protein